MGYRLKPHEIQQFANSTNAVLDEDMEVYLKIEDCINEFGTNQELEGNAWTALKTQLMCHQAVLRGMSAIDKMMTYANAEYVSAAGTENLDQDEIEQSMEDLRTAIQVCSEERDLYEDVRTLNQSVVRGIQTLVGSWTGNGYSEIQDFSWAGPIDTAWNQITADAVAESLQSGENMEFLTYDEFEGLSEEEQQELLNEFSMNFGKYEIIQEMAGTFGTRYEYEVRESKRVSLEVGFNLVTSSAKIEYSTETEIENYTITSMMGIEKMITDSDGWEKVPEKQPAPAIQIGFPSLNIPVPDTGDHTHFDDPITQFLFDLLNFLTGDSE